MPKGMGGLGFHDLRLFNFALLGRQVQQLVNSKDTLCYRVLSSKYFLEGDVFNSKNLISPPMPGRAFVLPQINLRRD